MIENIEFEGVNYPVLIDKLIENNITKIKFSIVLNDKPHQLKATIDTVLVDDLKQICGLDAEKELENVIIYEIKLEIFQILYNTTVKEQFDKVQALADKSDNELQELIDTDELFAIYMRNFNKGV